MPITELEAVADAYVDEGDPDSNFGTDTILEVRSDGGNNARSYLAFDMDQLPDDFHDFDDPLSVIVQVVASKGGRTIDLHEVTESFDESTLTWNTQPAIGDRWGSDDSDPDQLSYDLLGFALVFPTSGLVRFRLSDDDEGGGLLGPFEQTLASREHATEAAPVLQIGYIAAQQQDLASAVTVQRSAATDLPAHVLPRLPGHAHLATAVDVVFVEDLVATVTPALAPLAVRARLRGIITRLFLEPLEDFRRITDEAGSIVTHVQDGDTQELRRIVQVVASGTPAFSLSETPTFPGTDTGTPDTLRRGDGILFALGSDRWDPGARVTVEDAEFVVAGVLGTERLEDQVLYQEIGLRRLSVTAQGRALGLVG